MYLSALLEMHLAKAWCWKDLFLCVKMWSAVVQLWVYPSLPSYKHRQEVLSASHLQSTEAERLFSCTYLICTVRGAENKRDGWCCRCRREAECLSVNSSELPGYELFICRKSPRDEWGCSSEVCSNTVSVRECVCAWEWAWASVSVSVRARVRVNMREWARMWVLECVREWEWACERVSVRECVCASWSEWASVSVSVRESESVWEWACAREWACAMERPPIYKNKHVWPEPSSIYECHFCTFTVSLC